MATFSEAVNYKSFIDGMAKRCKHINGTVLDELKQATIYNYLITLTEDMTSNLSQVIPIKNAKKLMEFFTNRSDVIDVKDTTQAKCALSKNSAVNLLNKLTEDEVAVFATMGDVYGTTEFNDYNYIQQKFYCIDTSSTLNIKGTLYGGGGGGSGGCGSDGEKNCSVYLRVQAGANGGDSSISCGIYGDSALGGVGGAAHNHDITSSTDYPYGWWGSNGADGEAKAVDMTIDTEDEVIVTPGYGGGGSGGVSVKVSYGGSTFTGYAGSNYNGGNGGGANSWPSDDSTFGGGGGYSGYKNVGEDLVMGTQGVSHLSNVGDGNIEYGRGWNKGKGGTGDAIKTSLASEVQAQDEQPNTIGAGGKQGKSGYRDDVFHLSNGGNAGNNGGFVVDSSCSNILIMFKGGVNKI